MYYYVRGMTHIQNVAKPGNANLELETEMRCLIYDVWVKSLYYRERSETQHANIKKFNPSYIPEFKK